MAGYIIITIHADVYDACTWQLGGFTGNDFVAAVAGVSLALVVVVYVMFGVSCVHRSPSLAICKSLLMLPARILCLLATNHIFIEVSPDVFANNGLSSASDTGKSVEELLARLSKPNGQQNLQQTDDVSPESKHTIIFGIVSHIAAMYEFLTVLLTMFRS